MIRNKVFGVVLYAVLILAIQLPFGNTHAGQKKIGVINMQKVLAMSEAGKAAQEVVSKKMKEFQAAFKSDEEALRALQKEIEKKSSAWSDEMKQEKTTEFNTMRFELAKKQEKANGEMKKLRDEKLEPIVRELRRVVAEIGKKDGYTVILPSQAIVFADEAIDLTREVTEALNKAMQ